MSWSYTYNKINVNPNVVRLKLRKSRVEVPSRSHLCDVCGEPIKVFDRLEVGENGDMLLVNPQECVIETWDTMPYERRGYKFRKETVTFLTTFRHKECKREEK